MQDSCTFLLYTQSNTLQFSPIVYFPLLLMPQDCLRKPADTQPQKNNWNHVWSPPGKFYWSDLMEGLVLKDFD